MLTINVNSADVTCTTVSLPKQMLTTKLFTMHLAVVGFWEVMGRMKMNFFDVLDKYNIETANV